MFKSRAVPIHHSLHIDGAKDELASALDVYATQIDTGTRPAAAYEGRDFFETNRFSRDTGASWDEVTAGAVTGKPFQTMVVAAADAISSTGADYTCDGTDDQVQINAAITALGATGGIVHLTEGTFYITAHIDLATNTILEGSGPATILKIPTGNASTFDMIENSNQSVGNTYLTIRKLTLDGNRANVSGTNKAIDFARVGQSWIEDCVLQNFSGDTIYLTSGSGTSCTETWICNNYFYNGAADFIEIAAACTILFIQNNHFNTADKGINISNASALKINITGNVFDNIVTYGVEDNGADYCVISENIFTGAATCAAMYIYNTTEYSCINDNIVTGCLYGIKGVLQLCTVCGNQIEVVANGYGMYLYPTAYCTFIGNTLVGTAGCIGFYLRTCIDSVFANNLILNNATSGIYMFSGCHRNIFMANVGYGNGEGIRAVSDSEDLSIIGNNFQGTNISADDDTSANPIIQGNIANVIGDLWATPMIAADGTDNNKAT